MCAICRENGKPASSFGCIPLETVIARVCIVRVPQAPAGKRGGAASSVKPAAGGDDDRGSRFVLNDLVGVPPDDLLPVVREDVVEELKERGLRPSEMRAELSRLLDNYESLGKRDT